MFSFARSGMIIIDYTYTFITKTAEVENSSFLIQQLSCLCNVCHTWRLRILRSGLERAMTKVWPRGRRMGLGAQAR